MTKLNHVIARPDLWFFPGEPVAEDENYTCANQFRRTFR
jgi:hypothetical protein